MKSRWLHIILVAIGVFLLVGGVWAIGPGGLWKVFSSREALEQWVRGWGAWGPGVIIVAEILQVLVAPVPGQIVGLVAGYLYGTLWGTLICMVGLAIGSVIAMGLGRSLGRPLVEKVASKELLARVDGYLARRGAQALLLIFLLPFLPDDICCFIAGLTPLRMSEMFLLALVGRWPGVLVSTLIGSQAKNLTWLQLGLIGMFGLALALLFLRYQERLEAAMFALLERFNARKSQGRS
jgi:uncharacterized membrane protein YdjX (TVP38/TMEM64 family)